MDKDNANDKNKGKSEGAARGVTESNAAEGSTPENSAPESRTARAAMSVVALVFMAIIFLMAFATLNGAAKPMANAVLNAANDDANTIRKINKEFEDNIAQKARFIDLFGLVQRGMGKREIDNYDIVKDNNGMLILTVKGKTNKVKKYTENVLALYSYARENSKDFLLIEASDYDLKGVSKMPVGVTNYGNANIDMFLDSMRYEKIPYIDVRELWDGLQPTEMRYPTDNHWAMPLVFRTFTATRDYLNKHYGTNLDPDGVYTDPGNYKIKTYPDFFLGSLGIRVGKYYAGKDDFQLYLPKFDTDLSFKKYMEEHKPAGEFSGDFRETFIDESMLKPNHVNKYMAYLQNGNVENIIENKKSTNDLKCLLIADSFGRPYAQYLSLLFKDTVVIDVSGGDRFKGNVKEYINQHDPDIIICMSSGHAVWHPLPGF